MGGRGGDGRGRGRGGEGCSGEGRRETGWEGDKLGCSHLCTTHTQEEYDIVTNDYEKAKSLFAGTQVKVFKKGTEQLPM